MNELVSQSDKYVDSRKYILQCVYYIRIHTYIHTQCIYRLRAHSFRVELMRAIGTY